jgi:putative tricarboxylic transport membrane protein
VDVRMSVNDVPTPRSRFHYLRRTDVLAGLLFIAVAVIGLWASRIYPIGTTTRMGTGYVPRLLCWILLALGVLIAVQGLRTSGLIQLGRPIWRAIVFVPLSLLVFAFLIGQFGVVIATVALVVVGALAGRESRPLEVAVAAVFLVILTLAIFVWGVGLPIPVWPEW